MKLLKILLCACALMCAPVYSHAGELKPDLPPIEEEMIQITPQGPQVCGAKIGDKISNKYDHITASCAGGIKMFSYYVDSKNDWSPANSTTGDYLIIQDGPVFRFDRRGVITEIFIPGMLWEPWTMCMDVNPNNVRKCQGLIKDKLKEMFGAEPFVTVITENVGHPLEKTIFAYTIKKGPRTIKTKGEEYDIWIH